jgi:hypothetical protein
VLIVLNVTHLAIKNQWSLLPLNLLKRLKIEDYAYNNEFPIRIMWKSKNNSQNKKSETKHGNTDSVIFVMLISSFPCLNATIELVSMHHNYLSVINTCDLNILIDENSLVWLCR